MNFKITLLAVLCVMIISNTAAYSQYIDSVKVNDLTLFVNSDNTRAGRHLSDSKSDVFLSSDSIFVKSRKNSFVAPVSEVYKIALESGSRFKLLAVIGGATGLVAGYIYGSSFSSQMGGFWGGLIGAAIFSAGIGGVLGGIGALIPAVSDFEIPDYPLAQKRAMILKILRDNRAK